MLTAAAIARASISRVNMTYLFQFVAVATISRVRRSATAV
jgi:hypothetical protein